MNINNNKQRRMFAYAHFMQMKRSVRGNYFGREKNDDQRTHTEIWHKNENAQPKRILHTQSEFGALFFKHFEMCLLAD